MTSEELEADDAAKEAGFEAADKKAKKRGLGVKLLGAVLLLGAPAATFWKVSESLALRASEGATTWKSPSGEPGNLMMSGFAAFIALCVALAVVSVVHILVDARLRAARTAASSATQFFFLRGPIGRYSGGKVAIHRAAWAPFDAGTFAARQRSD